MHDPDRNTIPVCAARAYAAGVGSSGSLLAAAAALFLLGSAIVAFEGWPQIAAGAPSSNVAAAPAPVTSHASRRLSAAVAAARLKATPARPRRVGPASAPAAGAQTRVTHADTAGGGPVSGTPAVAVLAGSAARGGGSSDLAASGCGACGSAPQTSVARVGKTVVTTVSSVGSAVGTQVTQVTGTVEREVGSVSSTATNAVQSVGATVGNTVAGTTTTATTAVSAVSSTLGLRH